MPCTGQMSGFCDLHHQNAQKFLDASFEARLGGDAEWDALGRLGTPGSDLDLFLS